MTVLDAQRNLHRAYVGGGPGVFTSALVWCAAALVQHSKGIGPAFAVLFFGGMLIFPLSTAVCRVVFRRQKEASDNLLGTTALESTVAMMGGLVAAWLFLRFHAAYVFPVAAIAVGTRYTVFKTVYGDASFWLLGALITAVGLLGIFTALSVPGGTPLAVGLIEFIFGIFLTMRARQTGDAQEIAGFAESRA